MMSATAVVAVEPMFVECLGLNELPQRAVLDEDGLSASHTPMLQSDPPPTMTAASPEQVQSASEGYAIRVVARITGISVDTLRVWERRYGLPTPVRNSTGVRKYTEEDVERLILVARALKMGVRAGEAIRMDVKALTQLVADVPLLRQQVSQGIEDSSDALLSMAKAGDMGGLHREIGRISTVCGSRHFVREVIAPLLDRVGAAWNDGELELYQEHLLTEALLSHLKSLARDQERHEGPKILLATLPRETHGLGLEMTRVMASACGANVLLLGTDCPPREIVKAASDLGVQAVGLSVSTASTPNATLPHIQWLSEHLPPTLPLWLGGNGAMLLHDLPHRVQIIREWQDLEDGIRGLTRGI